MHTVGTTTSSFILLILLFTKLKLMNVNNLTKNEYAIWEQKLGFIF
jgi:hypothetical protein